MVYALIAGLVFLLVSSRSSAQPVAQTVAPLNLSALSFSPITSGLPVAISIPAITGSISPSASGNESMSAADLNAVNPVRYANAIRSISRRLMSAPVLINQGGGVDMTPAGSDEFE